MKSTHKLITSKSLVQSVSPSVKEIDDLLDEKISKGEMIKIFYGETYDQFGITLGSLKYYLFLSLLHKHIESIGGKVLSTVLEADVASVLNKSTQGKTNLLGTELKNRIKLFKKIKNIYQLPINFKLMSHLFETSEYQTNIKIVNSFVKQQSEQSLFFNHLQKTVLQNRLNQERKTGFKYSRESIATSMCFDIKIGPPREIFYDKAQQLIANELNTQQLSSVYLTPTFPLGQNFSFFLSNPKIEKYGVTPYKAGSNKLQEYRVLVDKTSFDIVEKLIETSFESLDLRTVHPVHDLFTITQLARMAISNEPTMIKPLSDFSSVDELKKNAVNELKKYIYQPLGLT